MRRLVEKKARKEGNYAFMEAVADHALSQAFETIIATQVIASNTEEQPLELLRPSSHLCTETKLGILSILFRASSL